MLRRWMIMAAGLVLPAAPVGAATPDELVGTWVTAKQSEITIAYCETGLCGALSHIVVPPEVYAANKEAIDQLGVENFKDHNNKDPRLRQRSMLGLQILTLVTQKSETEFEGEVYNPEDGNTYYGKLEVIDPVTVRLTGCGFFNLICMSEDWVRSTNEARN